MKVWGIFLHVKDKQNVVFSFPPTSVSLSAHPERLHGAGPAGVERGQGFPAEAAVSWRAHPEGQRGAAEEVREQRVPAGTARCHLCHLSDRAPKPTV